MEKIDKLQVHQRVSLRFHLVCKELTERYNVSYPVATEMILDEFCKSGIIIWGKKLAIEEAIEKVTKELKKKLQENTLLTKSDKQLTSSEKQDEKEKEKTDPVTQR